VEDAIPLTPEGLPNDFVLNLVPNGAVLGVKSFTHLVGYYLLVVPVTRFWDSARNDRISVKFTYFGKVENSTIPVNKFS
jgi:hypothetical protein